MAISKNSSIASTLYPTLIEETLYVAREMNLAGGLVYNYAAQGMAVRYLGIYPTLTASTKAEGVDYANATEFTKTEQMSITPKTEMVQVVLTDERMATDPEGALADAAREMGAALAAKIDQDVFTQVDDFTTDVGTAGSALSIGRCAAALAILQNNHVPMPINAVVHPYGWFDLWTELGQPVATKTFLGDVANQAMKDYSVGNFIGVQWYTSSNVETASTNAYSGMWHREAIALDTRQVPTLEPQRDASLKGTELNLSASYGVDVRRPTYGIQLTHDITTPTGI